MASHYWPIMGHSRRLAIVAPSSNTILWSVIAFHSQARRFSTHWGRGHLNCLNARSRVFFFNFNPLNAELNPICYLLALLAHHFLYVSRIRVKLLTHRLLMSYIYMEHPFLMFLDHTQRRSTFGRTRLDEWSARVVSVVCCQVEVSATSWSLFQRSPTDCAASLCVI